MHTAECLDTKIRCIGCKLRMPVFLEWLILVFLVGGTGQMVSLSKLVIVALAIMDPAYNDREFKPTELSNPVGETLTARESEILAWIIQGFRDKNVARMPKISPETASSRGVHGTLKFGPFELSGRTRVLRRGGITLPLGSRAFDILLYLAERPGELIGKTEFMDHVWPNVTVDEGNLRVHVAAIRKALGDGQFGDRYIANVKGRGYAFIASVVRLQDSTEQVSDRPRAVCLFRQPPRRRPSMLRRVRLR